VNEKAANDNDAIIVGNGANETAAKWENNEPIYLVSFVTRKAKS
jgi:hypothetical protein